MSKFVGISIKGIFIADFKCPVVYSTGYLTSITKGYVFFEISTKEFDVIEFVFISGCFQAVTPPSK